MPARHQKLFAPFWCSLLLTLNLFLFSPLTIYGGNHDEFAIPLANILSHYLLPALILLGVLTATGAFLRGRAHRIFVAGVFALGILVWIQGNLLVWNYGVLNGQNIDWSAGQWRGWVDGILWILAFAILLRYSGRVLGIATTGSLALITLQVLLAAYLSFTKPEIWSSGVPDLDHTPDWASDFSSTKNVVQLILDGLQSDVFEQIVKEDSGYYSRVFDGFTFFSNATGHFPSTHLSVPALLSGKVYDNDVPLPKFFKATFEGRTTVNVLHEHGYDVDLIPWGEMVPPGEADHYHLIPSPYTGTIADYARAKAAVLLDLVLFRDAPHLLKRVIYNDQKWLVQRAAVHDERMQFRHFGDQAFLENVTSEMSADRVKPVYKCYHLESTHPPFVTNADCGYAGKVLPFSREHMVNQIRCGLTSAVAFLERMKTLGIYDNSLIILQADHGYVAAVELRRDTGLIEGYDLAPWMVSSAMPLLMVKPPLSRGPLRQSAAPVMLSDIPATICSILNINNDFPGRSVFDVRPEEARVRPYNYFFYAFVNWNGDHLPPIDQYLISGDVHNRSAWHRVSTPPAPPSSPVSEIDFGTETSEPYLGYGWSYKEIDDTKEGVTWALGDSASMNVSLPARRVKMVARVKSLISVGGQTVTVLVDGKEAGRWNNSSQGEWEENSVTIEPGRDRPPVSRITFRFSDYLRPNGAQNRRLALLFKSLRFEGE